MKYLKTGNKVKQARNVVHKILGRSLQKFVNIDNVFMERSS